VKELKGGCLTEIVRAADLHVITSPQSFMPLGCMRTFDALPVVHPFTARVDAVDSPSINYRLPKNPIVCGKGRILTKELS